MLDKQEVVIIGNGMVGHHLVEQLKDLLGNKKVDKTQVNITVLSAEPRLAYDRVNLSEFFGGKTAEDLAMTSTDEYQQWNVNFRVNAKVVDINRVDKVIITQIGRAHV